MDASSRNQSLIIQELTSAATAAQGSAFPLLEPLAVPNIILAPGATEVVNATQVVEIDFLCREEVDFWWGLSATEAASTADHKTAVKAYLLLQPGGKIENFQIHLHNPTLDPMIIEVSGFWVDTTSVITSPGGGDPVATDLIVHPGYRPDTYYPALPAVNQVYGNDGAYNPNNVHYVFFPIFQAVNIESFIVRLEFGSPAQPSKYAIYSIENGVPKDKIFDFGEVPGSVSGTEVVMPFGQTLEPGYYCFAYVFLAYGQRIRALRPAYNSNFYIGCPTLKTTSFDLSLVTDEPYPAGAFPAIAPAITSSYNRGLMVWFKTAP